jgi:hypothetical protein
MNPKKVAKYVIKMLLLLSGIVFSVYSIYGVIGKFINHQTTMSISKQPPKPLKPPAFTFCPAEGFDDIKMLDTFAMRARERFLQVDPNNEKIKNVSLVKVFKDSSYVIGSQILINMKEMNIKDIEQIEQIGKSLKIGTHLIKTSTNDSYEIRIDEMFTTYKGLCYTLMIHRYLSGPNDYFIISIEYRNFSSSPFPIEIELANEADRFNLIGVMNDMSTSVRFLANPRSHYMVLGLAETWISLKDCDFETRETLAICQGKLDIHQMEALNCSKKCVPVQWSNFNYLTKDIKEICTSEDHNCHLKIFSVEGKCVQACHRSQ